MIPRVPIASSRRDPPQLTRWRTAAALYVSGARKVVVKGGRVEANRAAEDGGGLRVTYASDLRVEGVAIRDNQ